MNNNKKNRKNIFIRLLVLINLIFVLFLLSTYLSPYASPQHSPFLAFFGLAYPIILLVNVFFAIFWIILWKKYFLISVVFLALGFSTFQRHFALNKKSKSLDLSQNIKIVSYNVQNLAKSNLHIQNKETRENIFNFLLSEDPDIVCMQEFYYVGKDTLSFITDLRGSLNLDYIHKKNYYQWKYKIHALVTLSSYPIIQTGHISIDNKRTIAIFTDLLFKKDTIRLYNVHLESIRFQESDLRFVSEMSTQPGNNNDIAEGSKSVFRKIGQAFKIRSIQAKELSSHIEQCRYPVIVCGDFNDTPASFAYRSIRGEMTDAFIESGFGYGNTYAGKLPPIRIDYIFYDPAFASQDFNVHKVIDLSDHYPISSNLLVE